MLLLKIFLLTVIFNGFRVAWQERAGGDYVMCFIMGLFQVISVAIAILLLVTSFSFIFFDKILI